MTKAGTVDICFFRDEKQTVSISAPACIRTEEDGAKVCFEVPDAASGALQQVCLSIGADGPVQISWIDLIAHQKKDQLLLVPYSSALLLDDAAHRQLLCVGDVRWKIDSCNLELTIFYTLKKARQPITDHRVTIRAGYCE